MDDLISRQDAIEELECVGYDFSESGLSEPELEELCEAIGEVEQDMIMRIRRLPSAQQWIPVTEHTLPNHNSVVVVCGEKGTWDFGTYRGLASTNIFFWNWKKNTVKEVHWWMYKEDALPMPWEGGKA